MIQTPDDDSKIPYLHQKSSMSSIGKASSVSVYGVTDLNLVNYNHKAPINKQKRVLWRSRADSKAEK